VVCTQCGTRLHDAAQRCWNCGTETPNYAAGYAVELDNHYQEASEERLQSEKLWSNPERISSIRRKLIWVQKETWTGRRLAGWVDEFGHVYRSNWPKRPIVLPDFSADEQGRIYTEVISSQ
jgi:hypothetical protein